MQHDPITDMFVRIKNAQAVGKEKVMVPHSNLKQEIAQVLKNTGFIADFKKRGRGVRKRLEITLSYRDEKNPAISEFVRQSTPGQRHYVGYQELYPVKSGYGIGIMSTSKGVMSDREARKQKVGGELLVKVW